MASILLAALALVLLPWPLHPATGQLWIGGPLALWIAVEGAFLVPLLPGLLAPSPLAARAAVREAQIGAAGRFVVWLAVGTALWSGVGWAVGELPGRALAALAGLLALPAAIGIGIFSAERSLSAAGAEEGLDEATADLLRFARIVRGAALLALLIVAVLPGPAQRFTTPPALALGLIRSLFLIIGLALHRVGQMLRFAASDAAGCACAGAGGAHLPLAVAGLVYIIVT